MGNKTPPARVNKNTPSYRRGVLGGSCVEFDNVLGGKLSRI